MMFAYVCAVISTLSEALKRGKVAYQRGLSDHVSLMLHVDVAN